MDFKKLIEDSNRLNSNEKLDDLLDYWLKAQKGVLSTKSKTPVLAFKKINKSPEF